MLGATTSLTVPTMNNNFNPASKRPTPLKRLPATRLSPCVNQLFTAGFTSRLLSPTALRVPTSWRCGACTALHPIVSLFSSDPVPLPLPLPQPASPCTSEASYSSTDSCSDTTTSSSDGFFSPCACASPALQAVYDQFGELALFWRDDPAVSDLRDPAQAAEARWRVWRAGAGLIADELGLGVDCVDLFDMLGVAGEEQRVVRALVAGEDIGLRGKGTGYI